MKTLPPHAATPTRLPPPPKTPPRGLRLSLPTSLDRVTVYRTRTAARRHRARARPYRGRTVLTDWTGPRTSGRYKL